VGFLAILHDLLGRWSDAWVFLTAAGTIGLAAATFSVIFQGKRQREDAERQHRDRLKPICVLTPFDGVDPWDRRNRLIDTIAPSPDNASFGTVVIKCTLRNIGTGPALNLSLRFRFLDMEGRSTEPWELSPLGVGESFGNETSPLLVPFWLHDQFNKTDFTMFTNKPWEIWLEYRDVFGQRFQAVHTQRPTQPENQKPVRGTDKVYFPPQPWVTFPDKLAVFHGLIFKDGQEIS
jgi:hypothetical protein